MNKKIILTILLVIISIFIVGIVGLMSGKTTYLSTYNLDKKEIDCIAEKSILYYSSSCVACARQEEILGDSLEKFNRIDCKQESSKCYDAEIIRVPTWIINDKKYEGVKEPEELQELAGC